jgi:hypothetical protein
LTEVEQITASIKTLIHGDGFSIEDMTLSKAGLIGRGA